MRIIYNDLNENEKVSRIVAYGFKNRFPQSLSNLCFGLSKNKAKELANSKYPEIKSFKNWEVGGNKFQEFVINLIINKAKRSAKIICRDLNKSKIGYTDWIVKETEKNYCILFSKTANIEIRIGY